MKPYGKKCKICRNCTCCCFASDLKVRTTRSRNQGEKSSVRADKKKERRNWKKEVTCD